MKAPRCTKDEKVKRIDTVFRLILDGYLRHEIQFYVNNKTSWGIAENTIDWYIHRANDVFAQYSKNNMDNEIGKSIGRLNRIYQKAFSMQDYKTAIQAQKEIIRLLGLDRQDKGNSQEDFKSLSDLMVAFSDEEDKDGDK